MHQWCLRLKQSFCGNINLHQKARSQEEEVCLNDEAFVRSKTWKHHHFQVICWNQVSRVVLVWNLEDWLNSLLVFTHQSVESYNEQFRGNGMPIKNKCWQVNSHASIFFDFVNGLRLCFPSTIVPSKCCQLFNWNRPEPYLNYKIYMHFFTCILDYSSYKKLPPFGLNSLVGPNLEAGI